MSPDTASLRRAACIASFCLTALAPALAQAGSPGCGAAPVLGRDGVVLYWTGGTACGARDAASGTDGVLTTDDGTAVSRGNANPSQGGYAGEPMPESRPVTDAISVAG
ncbi:MAG: hypothetical protein MUF73_03175 [Rhodobacteraceae bacterium]|jgi:hypothetical protein|nr:hypothetical protein [Paracoccaceae bacterium]